MNMLFRLIVGMESLMLAVMLVLATAGFLIFPVFSKYIPSDLELPLEDLNSIAVDDEGRIYLSAEMSRRIQVFDGNGKFIRGWFVEEGRGDLRLNMNEDDNLEVYRRSNLYIYDSEGNLLERSSNDQYAKKLFGTGMEYTTESAIYFLDRSSGSSKERFYIYPSVSKIDSEGNRTLVISKPFFMWIATTPISLYLFVIGIFLAILINPLIERQLKINTERYNLKKLQGSDQKRGQQSGNELEMRKIKELSEKQHKFAVQIIAYCIKTIVIMLGIGILALLFAFLAHVYTTFPKY